MKEIKSIVTKVSVPSETKTKQKEYLTKGVVPIIDQGQSLIGGYTNNKEKTIVCDLPVIVFGDHTCCVKYVDFPFGAGADGIKVLRPKDSVNPKYLYYGLQYLVFSLQNRGYGRHYQHIEKMAIPVPSLHIQERIVAQIEESLSQLDSAVETLQKTKQQLEVYRQAVLKEAFDTAISDCRMLNIGDLLTTKRKGMTTGPFGTMIKKSDHLTSGVPMLGIENIGRGHFVEGNRIFVSDEKAKELSSFQVFEGDLIISRSGTVGEICAIPRQAEKSLLSTNLIRITLNNEIILNDYFIALFQSKGIVLDQIKELCKGSTRLFLNQSILKRISFPVPILSKQLRIVEVLSARTEAIKPIETTINQSLKQAKTLRQSIIKQAFEGENDCR